MALTPKQEKFCHLYIETGNASEAYRQAYNAARMTEKSIGNRASELLQHRGIKGRVAALQAQHRKAHDVTVESIAAKFEEIYDAAMCFRFLKNMPSAGPRELC